MDRNFTFKALFLIVYMISSTILCSLSTLKRKYFQFAVLAVVTTSKFGKSAIKPKLGRILRRMGRKFYTNRICLGMVCIIHHKKKLSRNFFNFVQSLSPPMLCSLSYLIHGRQMNCPLMTLQIGFIGAAITMRLMLNS